MEAAQPHGMSLGGRPFCPKTSTGRARAVMDDIGRWTLLWSWLSLRVTVRLRFHARMMERVRGHKRKKRRIGIYWNILKHSEKQKQRGLSWRHFQIFSDMFNLVLLDVQFNHFNGGSIRPDRKCWQIPTCNAREKKSDLVLLWSVTEEEARIMHERSERSAPKSSVCW